MYTMRLDPVMKQPWNSGYGLSVTGEVDVKYEMNYAWTILTL